MRTTIKALRLFAGGQADVYLRRAEGETVPAVFPKGQIPPGDEWEPFESYLRTKIKSSPARDWRDCSQKEVTPQP